jgi:hypothetical protein
MIQLHQHTANRCTLAENFLQIISHMSQAEEIGDYIENATHATYCHSFSQIFVARRNLATQANVDFFRRHRHQERISDEMKSNEGLRCFVERRDLWTGARFVPAIPSSLTTNSNASTISVPDSLYWCDLQIPVAPPILPVEICPMRANITPKAYDTIYDKVVLQTITPSCPINLKDMTRSCVQGWKRDGTWQTAASSVPTPGMTKKPTFNGLFAPSDTNREKEGSFGSTILSHSLRDRGGSIASNVTASTTGAGGSNEGGSARHPLNTTKRLFRKLRISRKD